MPTLRIIWGANALLFFAVSGLLAAIAALVAQRHLYVLDFGAEGNTGLYMAMLMAARASASLQAAAIWIARTHVRACCCRRW